MELSYSVATEITVRAGQGSLGNLPGDTYQELTEALSYKPAGYKYTWNYRSGRSDGRVHLLRNHKFPAGLTQRIVSFLRDQGVTYDLRVEPEDGKPDLYLGTYALESRPYQDAAVEAALLNPRGVIQAPTGSGKTAVAMRVIEQRGKHAFTIAPTIDLLYQYRGMLGEHLGPATLEIGQMGDGVVNPQPITVATIRTAAKALGVAYESYEFGEYDDSDDTEVRAQRSAELLRRHRHGGRGRGAYPGCGHGVQRHDAYPGSQQVRIQREPLARRRRGPQDRSRHRAEIHRVNTEELVRDGYLVPPIIRVVNTHGWWQAAAWGEVCVRVRFDRTSTTIPGTSVKSGATTAARQDPEPVADCYREEIVENEVRNQGIADIVADLEPPVLVLVKQIKHGKRLVQLIPDSLFLEWQGPGRGETASVCRSAEW